MNELIVKMLCGEASDIEQQQLRSWRRESPENERAFQEMVRVWRLAELDNATDSSSQVPPVEGIIAEAEQNRAKAAPVRSTAKQRQAIRRLSPASALVRLKSYLLHRGPPTPGTS